MDTKSFDQSNYFGDISRVSLIEINRDIGFKLSLTISAILIEQDDNLINSELYIYIIIVCIMYETICNNLLFNLSLKEFYRNIIFTFPEVVEYYIGLSKCC